MREQFEVKENGSRHDLARDGDQKARGRSKRCSNLRTRLKLVLFVVCSGCLIKQMYDLIHQYVMRETQISVQYDYQDDVIPGITVCFPKALSIHQFVLANSSEIQSRYWPDFLEDLHNSVQSMSNLDEDDIDAFNKYFHAKFKNDAKFKEKYEQLAGYLSKAYDNIATLSKTNYLDVIYLSLLMHVTSKDLISMENNVPFQLSIPYNQVKCGKYGNRTKNTDSRKIEISRDGNLKCYPVEVNVFGLGIHDDVTNDKESWIFDEDPIESIVFKVI